ncbi:MAG: hypothetical protein Q9174_007118, partial [Haloplaca sp. 1 TL-2023]
SVTDEGSTVSGPTSSAQSESAPSWPSQEREGEMVTPPQSPPRKSSRRERSTMDEGIALNSRHHTPWNTFPDHQNRDITPKPSKERTVSTRQISPSRRPNLQSSQSYQPPMHKQSSHSYQPDSFSTGKGKPSSLSQAPQSATVISPFQYLDLPTGGILEQAWMMKMAGEIAKRVHEEKAANHGFWNRAGSEQEEAPPPAYGL